MSNNDVLLGFDQMSISACTKEVPRPIEAIEALRAEGSQLLWTLAGFNHVIFIIIIIIMIIIVLVLVIANNHVHSLI
jgi:hypothetical protein